MSAFAQNFTDPEKVARYATMGPPAFMPGHGGVLQMAGVLLAETMPDEGQVLVVGAGGGLDTRALANAGPTWRFVGVDPAPAMLTSVNEQLRLSPEISARHNVEIRAPQVNCAARLFVGGMEQSR